MLILGDISGIQDFLFDIRETGGRQAATLRFRSLRLQLIVECIARRVLWAFDLTEQDELLYCAAGKFAIELPNTGTIADKLDPIRAEVDSWLLKETHGRLRCAIVIDSTSGTAAQRNDAANAALQRRKLRPWAPASWGAPMLVVQALFELDAENERDASLGRRLVDGNVRTIDLSEHPKSDISGDSLVGVAVGYSNDSGAMPSRGKSSIPLDRIARYTPRNSDHSLVEFVDLAKRSRGLPMLGVFKADADNVGAAIRKALGTSLDFKPLKDFSQKLESFFGMKLDNEMSAANSRWNNIYTVFAGGDDLLLVGPWDIIIDFAAHVRGKFLREFESDGLTISAGCAIVKPKFPVHFAATQAETLLEHAKEGTKDQFATLGDTWKWIDHAKIIDVGKQLADWTEAGEIQRGWLHTLLELALLKRSKSNPRDSRIIPEMADSRLHYHIARNWPKTGPARQWADMMLQQFDQPRTTKDSITQHLPAILRYAMLASRSQGDIE